MQSRFHATFKGLASFVFCPFDQSLGRSVEEHQFGEQILLQFKLLAFSHHEDVQTQFENFVHVRHLVEHDSVRNGGKEQPHKLANQPNETHIKTNNTAGRDIHFRDSVNSEIQSLVAVSQSLS